MSFYALTTLESTGNDNFNTVNPIKCKPLGSCLLSGLQEDMLLEHITAVMLKLKWKKKLKWDIMKKFIDSKQRYYNYVQKQFIGDVWQCQSHNTKLE